VREVLLAFPHDLRFAFRMMRRSALVSVTIVLCLGFSVGATGTVFAWMETLILQPITGVKEFDRLVAENDGSACSGALSRTPLSRRRALPRRRQASDWRRATRKIAMSA
jgi:hypothetical protein